MLVSSQNRVTMKTKILYIGIILSVFCEYTYSQIGIDKNRIAWLRTWEPLFDTTLVDAQTYIQTDNYAYFYATALDTIFVVYDIGEALPQGNIISQADTCKLRETYSQYKTISIDDEPPICFYVINDKDTLEYTPTDFDLTKEYQLENFHITDTIITLLNIQIGMSYSEVIKRLNLQKLSTLDEVKMLVIGDFVSLGRSSLKNTALYICNKKASKNPYCKICLSFDNGVLVSIRNAYYAEDTNTVFGWFNSGLYLFFDM